MKIRMNESYDDAYAEIKGAYKYFKKNYNEMMDEYSLIERTKRWDYDAQKEFYNKWIDFANECKEGISKFNITGTGELDSFKSLVRNICRTVDYNFPYGWK